MSTFSLEMVKAQTFEKREMVDKYKVFSFDWHKALDIYSEESERDVKIIRHTKIRQGANPYDSEW